MNPVRSPLATLAAQVRPHRQALMATLALMAASAGMLLGISVFVRETVDGALAARDLTRLAYRLLIGVGIAGAYAALVYARDYYLTRLAARMAATVREGLFESLLMLPMREALGRPRGELLSRLSNDVTAYETALHRLVVAFVPSVAVFAALSLGMLYYSVTLTLVILLLLLPLAVAARLFARRMHTASRRAQSRIASLTAFAEEALAGLREIKSFVQTRFVTSRFQRESRGTLEVWLASERAFGLYPATVTVATSAAFAGLVLACAGLLASGRLDIPALSGFISCLLMAFGPLLESVRALGSYGRLTAAIERIGEITTAGVERDEDAGLPPLPPLAGHVRFDNISFSYGPSSFELRDVTLDIPSGSTVAIVGPSGAGKSTLLDTLLRFVDLDGGAILIDGHDIARHRRDSLRAQVGMVAQVPVLFDGTLLENLSFGSPEAGTDAVLAAAAAAHVQEFAARLPRGYETPVGPHGASLSVGQRQRVAIARVLLRNPRLLLLDEPTSALDPESERLVASSLATLTAGRTTLIVAHRLSTIRAADQIVVLEHGRLVEIGRHDELLGRRGLYHLLFAEQGEAFEP